MKIWVRSQNKSFFGKVKSLKVVGSTIWNIENDIILGEYENKERCIEVVNKFQKFLNDHSKSYEPFDYDYKRPMSNVEYEDLKKNLKVVELDRYIEIREVAIDLLVFEMPQE